MSIKSSISITAHAGAMGMPANTLEALRKVIEMDVDIVEMDVTFRSNLVPVIIHSEKPRIKQGVLFEDALKLVAGYERVAINLDLKSFVNLPVIEELAEKYGLLNRVFFTGVCEENVQTVKSKCPSVPLYLNMSTDPTLRENRIYAQELAEKLVSLGCVGLNCNYGQISRTIIEAIHENGLLVSVWTVDNEADMLRMISLTVDNITTKNNEKLKKLLEKHRN